MRRRWHAARLWSSTVSRLHRACHRRVMPEVRVEPTRPDANGMAAVEAQRRLSNPYATVKFDPEPQIARGALTHLLRLQMSRATSVAVRPLVSTVSSLSRSSR